MERSSSGPRTLRFGAYNIDVQAGELRKHGIRLKLARQPFQVLQILLEHPQEIVTREELRQRLWPNNQYVDHHVALKKAINLIRGTLGDSAENPRFIETIPRRGYRFMGDVSDEESGDASGGGNAEASRDSRFWARRIASAIIAMFVIAVMLFGAWRAGTSGDFRRWFSSRGSALPIQSVAVLPLENLSGDPSEDYFADGMTEELITELGQISSLRVTSRTSAMRYRGVKKPLPQIARELNVDAVVEGAVVRLGGQVRITAQLIQASSDKHIWAHTYQTDERDVLIAQSEIANAIAQQILSTLAPQEQKRNGKERPINTEAHEAYLKGEYFLNRLDRDSINKASDYFELAIARDPGYLPAYAKLAGTYQILGHIGALPESLGSEKAKPLVAKALQLDPEFGPAHAVEGWISLSYDLDFPKAGAEFRHAVELNPNGVEGHEGLANYYAAIGRPQQAVLEMRRALELDPLSLIVNSDLCDMLFFARRYDDALAQCNASMELGRRAYALRQTGEIYAATERYPEAVSAFRQADELRGASRRADVPGRPVATASAYQSYWKEVVRNGVEKVGNGKEGAFFIAQAYTYAGDDDRALTWLERALELRSFGIIYVAVDPVFDRLHSNQRFHVLLRRMGLAG